MKNLWTIQEMYQVFMDEGEFTFSDWVTCETFIHWCVISKRLQVSIEFDEKLGIYIVLYDADNYETCDVCGKVLNKLKGEDFFVDNGYDYKVLCVDHYREREVSEE